MAIARGAQSGDRERIRAGIGKSSGARLETARMNAADPLLTLTRTLREGADLVPEEVSRAVEALLAVDGGEETKADFLVALRHKGETAEEIAGFAEALLRHAVDPEVLPGTA